MCIRLLASHEVEWLDRCVAGAPEYVYPVSGAGFVVGILLRGKSQSS